MQYIDYGNTEEVNPASLVELPKSLTGRPPVAIKFMLHSLYTTSNHDKNVSDLSVLPNFRRFRISADVAADSSFTKRSLTTVNSIDAHLRRQHFRDILDIHGKYH